MVCGDNFSEGGGEQTSSPPINPAASSDCPKGLSSQTDNNIRVKGSEFTSKPGPFVEKELGGNISFRSVLIEQVEVVRSWTERGDVGEITPTSVDPSSTEHGV